jgi:cell division septum initiation protein DivIVA
MSGLSGLENYASYMAPAVREVIDVLSEDIVNLVAENQGLSEQVADVLEELSEERVRVEELRNIIDRMIERMIEAGVG